MVGRKTQSEGNQFECGGVGRSRPIVLKVKVKVKVKVKFTLERATKAQKGSRGIALLLP